MIKENVKKKFEPNRTISLGLITFLRLSLKLVYTKIKKSFFSIENSYIPHLFLLDKLVSRQGL
jgi:hypothetical protein